MAINKRKVLQSAQKNLQKGALDKALKDYQTLLKADPKDSNVRLKIGDIHLKQGNSEEAVTAYLKVADRFMSDGFDAKAVALYKQIVRLDEKRLDVYGPLAELYQRLGLNSDAMAALQTAADAHYREGNRNEALDLLRRMASLDPTHTANRMKVADLLRQEDRTDEAIAEFEAVAEELERQNDREGRVKALERVVELDPARTGSLVQLARAQLAADRPQVAEKTARALVRRDESEPVHHELLAEALEQSGQAQEARGVWQTVAELCRERGDEARARDLMQRYGANKEIGDTGEPVLDQTDGLAFGDMDGDADLGLEGVEFTDPGHVPEAGLEMGSVLPTGAADVQPPAEGGVSAPATDTGSSGPTALGGASGSESEPALDVTPALADAGATISLSADAAPLAHEPVAPMVGTSADPEQLVAEASVLVRYGKYDRAIETLRAVLAKDPQSAPALEKLAEAFEGADDAENAGEARRRLAEVRGSDALDTAEDEADDPKSSASATPADDGALDDIDIELDIDGDVEIDIEEELGDAPESRPGEAPRPEAAVDPAPEVAGADLAESIDFDLDLDLGDGGSAGDESRPAEVGPNVSLEPDADSEAADSVSVAVAESDAVVSEPAVGADAARGDSGPRTDDVEPTAHDLAEELGGFGDEALSIPGGTDESAEPPTASDEGPGADTHSGSSTTPQQMVGDLEEADFYFQQGLHAEARGVYERILAAAPSHPQAMLRLGEIEAAEGDAPETSGPVPGVPADATLDLVDTSAIPSPATAEALGLDDDGLDLGDDGLDLRDDGLDLRDEFDVGLDGLGDPAIEVPEPDPAEVADPAELPADEPTPTADAEGGVQGPGAEAQGSNAQAQEADANEDSGSFDLAAELADILGSDGDSRAGEHSGATEEEGFEQVFAAFKEGVQNELGEGDHEAHYDLGIAYKEMGLLDDAIHEFGQAMASPDRVLPCLHMMGLCALELGRVPDAVSHFEQALALPDIVEEHQVGLRFDLGRAYTEHSDVARARAAFEAVIAVDPDFGDAAERLAQLAAAPTEAAPECDSEAFESFDELLDEAGVSEARTPAEPEYESFDEFMGDDDAADEVATLAARSPVPSVEMETSSELEANEAPALASEPSADLEALAEVTAEPVDADPLTADPVTAEPIEADPVTGEPVDAEPVDAEPLDAEPLDAGRDASSTPEPQRSAEPDSNEAEPPSEPSGMAGEAATEAPATPKKRRRKKISFF